MFGLGGDLAKEVAFVFILLYPFEKAHFCDVQCLAESPFYKAVILYSLLFQNLDPFCNQKFCVFRLARGLKN